MELIKPMEPILTNSIMDGDGWVHQVKWDGIRGLCHVDNGRVLLYTRSGRERIEWYPEVSVIHSMLHCKQAVFDGELVVLNSKGVPSFYLVMSRERVKRRERLSYYMREYPVRYMVFDILYKDGVDLRGLALQDRQEILEAALGENDDIRIVSNYRDGEALFSLMKERQMEGIVSKRLNSHYIAGKKHREWFKTKIVKQLVAVVCGLKMKDGDINSLVIGTYEGNRLHMIGSVSSGLSRKDRRTLLDVLPQLKADESPSEDKTHAKDTIWLKPVLTVLVSFMEREPQGGLRHPVLVGFSSRKPSEATGEEEII